MSVTQTTPMSPELLVPRLGEYLVEKGIIKAEDLQRALEYQAELRDKGDVRLIGQVLIDLKIVDYATRESAITEQLLQLRTALQEANQNLMLANQQLEERVEQRTAELQRALEKLAEVNQLKANIVANISHELRTPLTHLKGYLELLLAADMGLGPLTDQQKNALSIMERSSERLGRLIEDLIMFSLSEREKLQLRITAFGVESLCKSAMQKVEARAKERGIELVMDCSKNLPQVEGDMDKIGWVILQFLDNAIKFTPAGGKISLYTTQEDKLVRLKVTDTGIGIPPGRTQEVFDSFHQLDGSTTRRAGGTGLGLALAKKIIEEHGSTIEVVSEVGKGTSFSFTLTTRPRKKT